MEEIKEKIKSDIEEIKKEQEVLSKMTQKSEDVMDEVKQIEQQTVKDENYDKAVEEAKQLKQELDQIDDKESGFYQDLSEKLEAKQHEVVEMLTAKKQKQKEELEAKKREAVEAIKTKKDKEKEVEELISEKKQDIKMEIEEKKRYLDENRNVDLEELRSIDVDKLKAEKEKLKKEIALNDITKEEFDAKSDEEKKEIRKAKERYLINKNRLKEINPSLELIETLDGKTPKEKFVELENLGKEVEKNFDKDNLDKILKEMDKIDQEKANRQEMLDEMIKGREKREEERYLEDVKSGLKETRKRMRQEQKEEQEEWLDYEEASTQEKVEKVQKESDDFNKDYSRVHLRAGKEVNKVHVDIEDRIKYIEISEKLGEIAWTDNHMNCKNDTTKRAFEEKTAKFKRLDIKKRCKEIAGNTIGGLFLRIKINPEIVMVLENHEKQLDEYISSIYNKTELPFELVHDLGEVGLKSRIQRFLFTRVEEKSGAIILGKLFNKNETLEEAKDEEVIESNEDNKSSKPIDEYRNVIDQETQAQNTEKILKEQEEKRAKDVQEIRGEEVERLSGDAVLDENEDEIAQL